ncbi:MAG: penicillin-binding protein activator, partial [Desulfosudaceae bacterium]
AGILAAKKKHGRSREIYRQLLEQYPGSRQAEDARLGMMRSWSNEGRYEKVLEYANTLDEQFLSPAAWVEKTAVVAESYLAMDKAVDAAYVLMSALKNLGARQQRELMPTMDRVAEKVGIDTLRTLLASIKNSDVRGQLTCSIGSRFMKKGNYEGAVGLLTDFIGKFPDNPQATEARALLVKIDKEAAYDHYAVGCLLPLSGKYSFFGNRALQGVQYAFQQAAVNMTTGETSPSPRLIIEDTGSDPEQALQAVRRLIEKKVAAIIGPLVVYREAIEAAQEARIPIITLTREDNIPGIGDYVFRNFLTPSMQVRSLLEYACGEMEWRRLAVLYPDESYGREFAHAFWDEMLHYDAQMVGFESYQPDQTDFADSIQKLVGLYYPVPEELEEIRQQYLEQLDITPGHDEEEAEKSGQDLTDLGTGPLEQEDEETEEEEDEPRAIVDFDVLFVPDGPSKASLILPQLVYYDIVDTVFFGTNLWYSYDLVNTAGKYVQGAMLPAAFWEKSQDSQVQRFVEGFSASFGEAPEFMAAVAYDTANILFQVILTRDNPYRSHIRNRLWEVSDYPGVTGPTSFDREGEVHKALPLLKIGGRSFYPVYQPDFSIPEAVRRSSR